MRGFDKHLHQILKKNPQLAREYAALIAELPVTTQLAIMRRRLKLSQVKMAQKISMPQSVISRLEHVTSNPRLSSLQKEAKVLHCHLIAIPDKNLTKVVRVAYL